MKKLAIFLVLAASCSKTVVVSGPPTAAMFSAVGAPSPKDAVKRFLTAAKNQDLQEMGLAWGTSSGPELKPGESVESKHTREQREIVMMCYLKHDTFQVLTETPAMNGERSMAVELKFKGMTRSTSFTATRGSKDRWFVREFDIEKLRDICARKA